MPDNDSALLTAEEIARRMKVTTRTIHRWRAAGMPCIQPGGHKGRLLFDESAVREWAAGRSDAA